MTQNERNSENEKFLHPDARRGTTPDDSFVGTVAHHDPVLNAWAKRTARCRRCTRVGGLRRLCDGCRESMPVAAAGEKSQVAAGRLARERKRAGR